MSLNQRPVCPACNTEANIVRSQKGEQYYKCPNECLNPKPNQRTGKMMPYWLGYVNGSAQGQQSTSHYQQAPYVSGPSSSSSASYVRPMGEDPNRSHHAMGLRTASENIPTSPYIAPSFSTDGGEELLNQMMHLTNTLEKISNTLLKDRRDRKAKGLLQPPAPIKKRKTEKLKSVILPSPIPQLPCSQDDDPELILDDSD